MISVNADEVSEPATFGYTYVLQAEGLAKDRAGVVQVLTGCGRDWIVLDAFFTGGEGGRWTAEEIATIRQGKAGRQMICYLSIGEAEDYRSYWQESWKEAPPAFLLSENPHWPGNYRVRYWDPLWQEIILKELGAILAQGFDGVLLDIVDGFEYFEQDGGKIIDNKRNPLTGNTYRSDMTDWVGRIARAARTGDGLSSGGASNPEFQVIPQNGTQLLSDPVYARVISAQALEDLFTVGDKPQPQEHISYIMSFVRPYLNTGGTGLLTEYGTQKEARERSRKHAAEYGLTLLLTNRALSEIGSSGASANDSAKPTDQ